MSWLSTVLVAVLTMLVVRNVVVLASVLRTIRFLRATVVECGQFPAQPPPKFFVLLPVLRETSTLRDAISHFNKLAAQVDATIVVVTTEREHAERRETWVGGSADTVALARELAATGDCEHVHYPEPTGMKGDQINFAANVLAAKLESLQFATDSFVVVYDADSRPPINSLKEFGSAIHATPQGNIFHQSSRFELRERATPTKGWQEKVSRAICDAGALRANRFVLAYELPRLLNQIEPRGSLRRLISSVVFTHVTGHGLCLRLSFLLAHPFPVRSPLEDMYYSFLLCSQREQMIPVPSLDCAEVPQSAISELKQLARWFYGPARFPMYLRDPAVQHGVRARLLAASAAGISIEWVSCAFVPIGLIVIMFFADPLAMALAASMIVTVLVQLLLVEQFMSPSVDRRRSFIRIMAYPISCTLFGLAGVIGLAKLCVGVVDSSKTERID